jgi:XTP/dITP diphosphohydrolase
MEDGIGPMDLQAGAVARGARAVLVLATRNRKKGREMEELLAPPWEPSPRREHLELRTLLDFPEIAEVEEDAADFAGNARKKATAAAQQLGLWTLADDSGLAVDALGGAPGVYSARYAGRHGDDAANNAKLLEELAGIADERRGAAFVCALALADPSGAIRAEASGACRGRIVREPRGENGFGYDPLFLVPEYHRTFGELASTAKHVLSHRARAFEHMRAKVDRLIPEILGTTRGGVD